MRGWLTGSIIAAMFALAVSTQAQEHANGTRTLDSGGCTQNWTTVDSDSSGTISEAEAKAVADSEFARIDVDGNGAISMMEWTDCGDPTFDLGERPAGRAADVDRTRAVAGSGGGGTSAGAEVSETLQHNTIIDQGSEMAPWTGESFEAFDADKSGALSTAEAAQASQADVRRRGEELARRAGGIFARADANGDGDLSAEEWSNRSRQSSTVLFGRVDADADGSISQTEWTEYRNERYTRSLEDGLREPTIWQYYYFVAG